MAAEVGAPVAESRTIHIDGAGPVLFERSRRAKRLSLSVRPFTGVRVAVPYRVSFSQAETFARDKAGWIKKHLSEIHQFEREYPPDAVPIDKERAKAALTDRLRQLADKHGFVYNRLSFRNQKTRWGSCSVRNNISLNIRLVRLPGALADYVLLHELVHTRIKDHSRLFWAEMDRLVGDGRKMSKRLKKYRLGVI